ncbi:MAG: hypothetical protein ACKVS9_10355 [Phycisphaerae bacterium]
MSGHTYTRARLAHAIAIFIATGGVASVGGELLSIINPSFETLSRPLAVGEQTNGSGGAGVPLATRFPFAGGEVSWANPVEVPGWRTRVRPFGDPVTIRAGVLNPPLLAGQPFITGQGGQHVFAIQNLQLGQTLNVLLQPNTRYTLTFLGGVGRFDSEYFLSPSLIAVDSLSTLPLENEPGVQRLAIARGLNVPVESHGTMLPYGLEYTSPAVLPAHLVGRFVGIHLYGSDGLPRVLYDDFRLDATPVPEPAGAAALGAAALVMGRNRRQSGKRTNWAATRQ